jgi:hypothetical protein
MLDTEPDEIRISIGAHDEVRNATSATLAALAAPALDAFPGIDSSDDERFAAARSGIVGRKAARPIPIQLLAG